VFETDPILASAFSGVIELGVFMLIYSLPIFFWVIVMVILAGDWREAKGSDNG